MAGRARANKNYPRVIKRRGMIFAAVIMIIINSAPVMAMAEGEAPAPPLTCINHTVHDEFCGYKTAAETQTCSHVHSEECYLMVLDCVHMAGDGRYNGIGADKGGIEHVRECYVQELYCAHTHSEACGYTNTPRDTPCRHICALCGAGGAGDPEPVLSGLPAEGQERREYPETNESAAVSDADDNAPLKVEITIFDHAGNRRTEPANETLYIGLFAAGFNRAEATEPRELVWDKSKNAYSPIKYNDLPQGDYYIYELMKKGGEFVRAARPDAEFPYFVSGDDGKLISIKDNGGPNVQTAAINNAERSAWVNIEANKKWQSGPDGSSPGEQAYALKIKREDGKPIKGDIKEITLTLRRAGAASEWVGTDIMLLPAGEYMIYEAESPTGAQGAISIEGSINGARMGADSNNSSVSFNVEYSHLDAHNPPSSTGPLYPSIDVKVAITGIDEADQ